MATKAVKLPSGSWRVRVQTPSEDGKRHYKSFTAPTRKEAEYQAAQYAYTLKEKSTGPGVTVGAAIASYIADRENVLSPTSIAAYKKLERNYYAGVASIKISALTPQDAQRLINQSVPGHSPKTVREIYSLFRTSVRQYDPSFSPVVNLPAKVHREMKIPTQADILEMLSSVEKTPMANALLLASAYGLRRGEISALTFADIDEVAQTLTINKSVAKTHDGKLVIKSPKSYAGTRTIKITPEFISAISHTKKGADSRICPLTPDAITRRFERLCAQLGISVRFHDLRHYNASLMLSLNIPDKYAMERLGQATPGMIKAVYQHIMDKKRNDVSDQMNNAVFSFIKKCDTKCDTAEEKP